MNKRALREKKIVTILCAGLEKIWNLGTWFPRETGGGERETKGKNGEENEEKKKEKEKKGGKNEDRVKLVMLSRRAWNQV